MSKKYRKPKCLVIAIIDEADLNKIPSKHYYAARRPNRTGINKDGKQDIKTCIMEKMDELLESEEL